MISRTRSLSMTAVGLLAMASAGGCGDGKPSTDTSLNEATVSGVVKANGSPVSEGGTIAFNPSNYGRKVPARTAEIGSDGHYTIKTYTGDNQVSYGGAVAKKHPGVGLRHDYATVKAGENTFDFDVLAEGEKKVSIDPSKMPRRKGP